MKDQNELESGIVERLNEIKLVPPRDSQSAQRSRAAFLSQAVSASELRRLRGWKYRFKKEQFAMNLLISILVIAGLLFGGGATVNAAQNDLPEEPLYALKTWSEDVSLLFQNDSEKKVNRLMELAQVRVREMERLSEAGQTVPDQVRLRLERHVQQALQICSRLDDTAMDRTLLRLRDQLRDRDHDMQQLQLRIHQEPQPVLERTREMLQLRLQVVNDGLLDHEMFRNTARNGFRHGQDEEFTPPAPIGTGQQNGQQTGQPTLVPGGLNTDPGGPNPDSGGMNTTPGGPNIDPGEPNMDPDGPNTDPGGNMNGSGPGPGGNSNDSGGNGYGGNDSGGGCGGCGGGNGP